MTPFSLQSSEQLSSLVLQVSKQKLRKLQELKATVEATCSDPFAGLWQH